MLSRNEIKYIQSLFYKKKRSEDKLFIVEGPKLAEEIINSKYPIKKLYALKEWIAENSLLMGLLVIEVTEKELAQLTQLQTANQVIVIAEEVENTFEPVENTWSIVLDGIQDPGNLGTIIRIADWFNIKNIVCSEDTVNIYNPKVIQSSMGSFVRVNVLYKELVAFLSGTNLPIYGALLNGDNVFKLKDFQKGFLMIGNESKGIRNHLLPFIQHPITIPKLGGAESLNAAVASGIILSHLI
jgi:TrmH family RNA methyltransferase